MVKQTNASRTAESAGAIIDLTGHNFVVFAHICSPSPCQTGGTCNVDESGEYICSCLQGTSGARCERKKLFRYILDKYVTSFKI